MQSHGLPGKIPTSFTTGTVVLAFVVLLLIFPNHVILVGKPYFENIQYNSPIEIYDDNTVDEMVKIMNSPGSDIGMKTEGTRTAPAPVHNGFKNGLEQPRLNEYSSEFQTLYKILNTDKLKGMKVAKTGQIAKSMVIFW